MKKLSLVIAALAMMLGITQCKKQENPVGGKLITQEVTFTTSFGDGSKLGVTEGTGLDAGTLSLKWEVDDKITVTDDATKPNASTLTCTEVSYDQLTGTFEGTITCIENAQLTFSVGTEPDYMNQHFTAINESIIYLVGKSDFEQSGNYVVDMALPYAILKVDLAKFAPESGSTDVSVMIGGIEGSEVAKVTEVSAEEHRFYLLLPLTVTEPTETTLTFTAGDKTITHTYTLASHGFYTAGGNGGFALIMPDYLCFTAEEDGAEVWLADEVLEKNLSEVSSAPELEYSFNGSNWDVYAIAKPISLDHVGDKVYFCRKEEAKTFSSSDINYHFVTNNKKIAASGNIMSLLDPECKVTEFDAYYGAYCFDRLFEGCTSLITAPELPATTLAPGCYRDMFNGCSKLNYIKVHFTSWASDVNATSGWVSGVPEGGTFRCPKDLNEINGDDNIPIGWTKVDL